MVQGPAPQARGGSVGRICRSGRSRDNPCERGEQDKASSKYRLNIEAHGIPLAAITTGGNRSDVTQLIPLIQAVPPIRGKRGQPCAGPEHLDADRGYDHAAYRTTSAGSRSPRTSPGAAPGTAPAWAYRWVADGAIALLRWFRRLRTHWEIRDDIHHAFVTLGCAVICWRRLRTALC
ncbi:hypothetical protein [Streptomyces sp. NPDC047043]|uniref:hypothetical protein n=1 Tax=Streptomyces sp. NPDC047043 TaxID=3154497 RepID=UPI0033FCBCA6